MSTNHIRTVITEGVNATDLPRLQALIAICQQHDQIHFPVNVAETPGTALLYYETDTLLGFAYLLGEHNPELLGAVHPHYRRQGIGRSLLQTAQTWCRTRQQESLLVVGLDTIPAGTAFAKAVGGELSFSEYHMVLSNTDSQSSPFLNEEGLSLRLATHNEASEISHLSSTAFGDDPAEIEPWITREILRSNRRFFFIELHGTPIGTISVVGEGEGSIDITTFGILPAYRQRGYGRKVLQHTVAMLQAEGWSQIALDVETDNTNALFLYQSCGFHQQQAYHYFKILL
ncbi:GNAT family N-acetyltransferase [Tengunoibacter tsumagoiensis]|uniref:N-acetyltransferase n=1 Tax=Tengunoibacter tsumagoiensis TaxID=2014871 RepID=A0A402A4K4_9CHLR|nr:GNAT family N-acetyltransferase [Tengunoibacter tsumagoiensis]GCE13935.1 N-acetyltransferase [Tengunoibacter tsumagoiensis]